VRHLADRRRGDTGLAFGVLERVRLDLRLVGLEAVGRPADELAVLEAGRDDLAPDRVRKRDIRADIDPEPAVGPLGGRGPARVDRVQPGALVDRLEDVMEEDRMRLPGIAAPEDDQIGVLDLAI